MKQNMKNMKKKKKNVSVAWCYTPALKTSERFSETRIWFQLFLSVGEAAPHTSFETASASIPPQQRGNRVHHNESHSADSDDIFQRVQSWSTHETTEDMNEFREEIEISKV